MNDDETQRHRGAFLITLIAAFLVGCIAALPVASLGLMGPLMIVLPLALGLGALVASLSSWALSQMLNPLGGRQGFLPTLIRAESTVMTLCVGILLLALSGMLFVPWIVTLPIAIAIIAYRVASATQLP